MELSRFGIKLLAADPAIMQEKNFVIIIKIHQFSDQTSCLIHYFLE